MEPCPLCFGALYMSGIRNLRYAARDPYAGSTNLLGATPYLSRKEIDIRHPACPLLEQVALAIQSEWLFGIGETLDRPVPAAINALVPSAVALGGRLYRTRALRKMAAEQLPIGDVVDWLCAQV